MQDAVTLRRSEAQRRREFDEELEENAAQAGAERDAIRSQAFRPCIAAKWSTLPQEMVVRCRRYLRGYGADVDEDGRDLTQSARAYGAWRLALRGEFLLAHKEAGALERDSPGSLEPPRRTRVRGKSSGLLALALHLRLCHAARDDDQRRAAHPADR